MAKLERTYTIPLRKEWLKKPKYKRAKKAITTIREFLTKHMKSEKLKISKELNDAVWFRGIKNPPHKIKVNVVKDDEGIVFATLFGVKPKEEKKEGKKEASEKKEEKKEAPKEKPKAAEKKPSKPKKE